MDTGTKHTAEHWGVRLNKTDTSSYYKNEIPDIDIYLYIYIHIFKLQIYKFINIDI